MVSQLNCLETNYQCGGKCQSQNQACHSGKDKQAEKVASNISEQIIETVTPDSIADNIKKEKYKRDIAQIETNNIDIYGNQSTLSFVVNGVEGEIYTIDNSDDQVEPQIQKRDIYNQVYQISESQYEIGFEVNGKDNQSSREDILMNIPTEIEKKYSSTEEAIGRTRSEISNQLKIAGKKLFSQISNGSIVVAGINNEDGKGKSRGVLYKRMGMEVFEEEEGLIAMGVKYNTRVVSAEKYLKISK